MNQERRSGFSLLEVSAVILIIGILIAGVMGGNILVAKTRIAAAKTLTVSSPINGIKDSALWLESSTDASFPEGESASNTALSTWYDARQNSTNKINISAVGSGTIYSNTINSIHAVKFAGSSEHYLQIDDASFLNNTDYTIIILEKRQSNSSDNYFFGESPTGTANQKIALGYQFERQSYSCAGSQFLYCKCQFL